MDTQTTENKPLTLTIILLACGQGGCSSYVCVSLWLEPETWCLNKRNIQMKNVIKFTARGVFADGVDVSSLSNEAIATAIKLKLGLPV